LATIQAVTDLIPDAGAMTSIAQDADLDALVVTVGVSGAGLTDLGGMSAAMKAEVNAESDTAISDASLATASSLATAQTDLDTITGSTGALLDATATSAQLVDDIIDEPLTKATHNVSQSLGKRVRQQTDTILHDGTAQSGTVNTITLDAGASSSDRIFCGDQVVLFGGTGSPAALHVIHYDGTSKVCVMDDDWPITPDATSDFFIVASGHERKLDAGLAQAGAANTITLRSGGPSTDLTYSVVQLLSGTGAKQTRRITAYDTGTKVATVDRNWSVNPTSTTGYMVYNYHRMEVDTFGGAAGTSVTNIETITAAIPDSGAMTSIAQGSALTTAQVDIDDIQTRIPTTAELAYMVNHAKTAKPVTFTSGTTTTAVIATVDGVAPSSTDDRYNGRVLIFNFGTLDEEATDITDYDGGSGTATFTATSLSVSATHTAILV